MKRLILASILAGIGMVGCAGSGNSSSAPAATTTVTGFGSYCPNCTNGIVGGGGVISSGTAYAEDYNGLNQITMNISNLSNGQAIVNGYLNVTAQNYNSCFLPPGSYPFQTITSFIGNLIMGGSQIAGLPYQSAIVSPVQLDQLVSMPGYGASFQVLIGTCSSVPVPMTWPYL